MSGLSLWRGRLIQHQKRSDVINTIIRRLKNEHCKVFFFGIFVKEKSKAGRIIWWKPYSGRSDSQALVTVVHKRNYMACNYANNYRYALS